MRFTGLSEEVGCRQVSKVLSGHSKVPTPSAQHHQQVTKLDRMRNKRRMGRFGEDIRLAVRPEFIQHRHHFARHQTVEITIQSQKRHGYVTRGRARRRSTVFRISSPPLSTSTSGIGNARTVFFDAHACLAGRFIPMVCDPGTVHRALKIFTEFSGNLPARPVLSRPLVAPALKQGDDATVTSA